MIEPNAKIFSWVSSDGAQPIPDLPKHDGLVLPSGAMGAFSADECARIIQTGELIPDHEATTSDGASTVTYSNRNTRVRTVFPAEQTNWIFDKLESIVANLMPHFKFDVVGFYEGAQVYRYPVGGFLNWHMDIGRGIMSTRKLAVSIQLSPGDSYSGGDLEFEDSNQPAPRQQGTVIVFPTFMRHRITPVTSGFRDSFVSWIHGPPFR